MARLRLDIGNLILRGVSASQAPIVAAALERELTRLFSRPGAAPAQGWSEAKMKSPALKLPAGAGAKALGTQAARRVHDGIQAGRRP